MSVARIIRAARPINNSVATRFVAVGLVVLGVSMVTIGRPFFGRSSAAEVLAVRVVKSMPHDPEAFSQGFVIAEGKTYEGTGGLGKSTLREVDLATGRVNRFVTLDRTVFGEGITVLKGKIYQLTWQNHLCFVYDLKTMNHEQTLRYDGEGWGLTTDGDNLISSSGNSFLSFRDPKTFQVTKRIQVRDGRKAIDKLNELEFVGNEILANVWYSDRIARINPQTGQVVGWLDLSRIYPANERPDRECVLNGIAYDSANKKLYVTGKNWPRVFEIEYPPVKR